eukprot:COSAG01_NODE_60703_length_293_cov_0.850515_1_plen_38_part_01
MAVEPDDVFKSLDTGGPLTLNADGHTGMPQVFDNLSPL